MGAAKSIPLKKTDRNDTVFNLKIILLGLKKDLDAMRAMRPKDCQPKTFKDPWLIERFRFWLIGYTRGRDYVEKI